MGVYKATLMKQLQHSAAATGSPALALTPVAKANQSARVAAWPARCTAVATRESRKDGAPPPCPVSLGERGLSGGVWPSRRKPNGKSSGHAWPRP